MAKYHLRFFVDQHRSLMLWSGNEVTKAKYDYSVLPKDLPLSPALLKDLDSFGNEIATRFGYLKSLAAYPELRKTADGLIARLKAELGDEYDIVDEMT